MKNLNSHSYNLGLIYLPDSSLSMEVCTRQRRAVQCSDIGIDDLWWRSGASRRFSDSLDQLGFGVGKYSGDGEPRVLSPWPPLPLIALRDRGATSLLTGWASPIQTRVKGPMSHWAHWWRDQSNIHPLDLIIYF
jgi:hypothetical protein